MAKHRKTLQQKKIADLRHKFYSFDQVRLGFDSKNIPSVKSNTFPETKDIKNVSTTIYPMNKYPYLLHDIAKTGILTSSIVAIQLILFILLKNKIILLPMVNY